MRFKKFSSGQPMYIDTHKIFICKCCDCGKIHYVRFTILGWFLLKAVYSTKPDINKQEELYYAQSIKGKTAGSNSKRT